MEPEPSASDDAPRDDAATRLPLSRIMGFMLVAGTLSLLLHLYLASRLSALPAWPYPLADLVAAAIWAGAGLVPLGLGLWRLVGRERVRWLTWTGLTWSGTMAYLVAILLPLELVRLVLPSSATVPFARAAALGALAVAAVLTVIGLRRVRRGPVEVLVDVPVDGLPPALDGLRIVHLSDIHVGPTIGAAELTDMVRRAQALEPDLVAITGDLVDGSVTELAPDVAVLATLRAPLGVYFVTGNHEYYSGSEAWMDHLRGLGVVPLANARRRVIHAGQALDVAGVPDVQGTRFGDAPDLARALAGRSADDPTPLILLAHQPKQAVAAAARGATLVLSGHTHAGQLAPFGALAKIGQPSIRGLVRLGATWLYTSEGTGYWGPPMRVGTRSEIALLTLRRAPFKA